MDFTREYVIQCLAAASNNLRLSSEKIEVVAILKHHLAACEDIGWTINQMKKITELSKFAIKLGEIYSFISRESVDYLILSDKFKEQSHNLIFELSNLLDLVSPGFLKDIFEEFGIEENTVEESIQNENGEGGYYRENFGEDEKENSNLLETERDSLKEDFILNGLETGGDFDFKDFEKSILSPIKELDLFLGKLISKNYSEEEIDDYIELTKSNYKLSKEVGFEILANMNNIISTALKYLKEEKLIAGLELVENMRACLIVTVAVVRGKEVDITAYLNRAEKFGKDILELD